jgi:hypothetical protein
LYEKGISLPWHSASVKMPEGGSVLQLWLNKREFLTFYNFPKLYLFSLASSDLVTAHNLSSFEAQQRSLCEDP